MNAEAGLVNLALWQNFYVVVGSSAGALIGVQFVVIALIASMRPNTDVDAINAFGTPTVVHLGVTLVVSAIMSAPWPSLLAVSVAIGVCGIGGVGYSAVIIRRARRQNEYKPVLEDWLWHVILPFSAYLALALAAFVMRANTRSALFAAAGGSLGLLLIGIHNAWDTVTHIVVAGSQADATKPK